MRSINFSPFLLAMLLTPVFLQTSTPLSCKSGDTTLSELAFIVEGEDQIVGFDPNVQSYAVSLPAGTDQALVHTVSTIPKRGFGSISWSMMNGFDISTAALEAATWSFRSPRVKAHSRFG